MRVLFLAILLISFSSCKKTICEEPGKNHEGSVNATVRWYGAPEVDGLGWMLQFETGPIEKPSNLGDQYKADGLKVSVVYEKTEDKYHCFCQQGFIKMIRIISIRKR